MAFTQAELERAARSGPGGLLKLFQREVDAGFMGARSLPANYQLVNGQVQVRPDSWMAKYGWLLPLAAMGGGLALSFLGPSAGGAAAAGAGGAGHGLDPALAALMNAGKVGAGAGASAAGAGTSAAAAAAANGGAGMAGTSHWRDIFDIGSKLFGDVFGSAMQGRAADRASQITADAARYAADRTAEANAQALDFERRMAQNAFANSEVGRRTDYGQWAARERRLGFIGDEVGMPAREIPDFIPGVDPQFGGSGGSGGAGGSSGGGMYPSRPENMPKDGEVNWSASPDVLRSQLSAFFKARGVADSEVPFWVSKAGELVARGREINDPNYANKRLAAADIFGGGASAGPAAPGGGTRPRPVARSPIVMPFVGGTYPGAIGAFM